MPELAVDEVDLGTRILGKRLRAPLLIAAMTGGTERAERINRELASIAEECGYAFGLGSQRAMHKRPGAVSTYQVREVAPTALVLGNVGIVQAHAMQVSEIRQLVEGVAADALCVHLNPQWNRSGRRRSRFPGRPGYACPAGPRARHARGRQGDGLRHSGDVARRVRSVGVRHVDVSGAGGTSWVAT